MKEIEAPRGDEFRVPCHCGTMWTTRHLPAECEDCGAIVSVTWKGGGKQARMAKETER